MRDINPDPYGPRERSIRNVSVSARTHHAPAPKAPPVRRKRPRRRMLLWSVGVLIVCIGAGVLISTVFAGARITLSPRTQSVTAPASLTATLNPSAGGFGYTVVTVTKTATTTVPATGTHQVSRQASGVITISNSYSTAPQRLIANTRFAAPDGKIYRVRDSVTVPGMAGGKPGTATATLYADSPGADYNRSTPTTFTIPGFKGDPRYTKFTAVSEGAISGGFVGSEPAVADADLSKAKAELGKTLTDQANAAAAAAIPDGYVAIPGTLKVTLGEAAVAPAQGGSATVVESAQATGAVVLVANLAAAIARATVSDYHGEAVTLDPSSSLTVSASPDIQSATLAIALSGNATLVWQFDPNAIRQALVGKPKAQFETILQSFAPAVACTGAAPCKASIRPFWHSSFPSNPDKIDLVVQNAK